MKIPSARTIFFAVLRHAHIAERRALRAESCGVFTWPALLCVMVLSLGAAPRALGNGRAPDTTAIVVNATDPNLILAALTFGAAVSSDAGNTWHWICEDAISGPSSDDARLISTPDGRYVMLNQTGLRVANSDGCNWAPVGDFNAQSPANSVYVSPDDANDWLVTYQAAGTFYGTLTRSRDGGATFAQVTRADDGELFYGAWFSADRQHWLIAASNNQSSGSLLLYRSDDGASTWSKSVVAGAPAASTLPALAVSAADTNVVLLTAFDVAQSQTAILHSADAGRTFASAGSVGGGLRGLGFDAAAPSRAWVSGTMQITASTDGGASFALLDAPKGDACVFAGNGAVYGCGNLASDGFTAARRASDATQWQPIFDMNQLQGPYHCDAGTPTNDLCLPQWAARAGVIGAPVQPLPSSTPAPAASKATGGCHCNQGAEGGRTILPLVCAGYGMLRLARQRTRRAKQQK